MNQNDPAPAAKPHPLQIQLQDLIVGIVCLGVYALLCQAVQQSVDLRVAQHLCTMLMSLTIIVVSALSFHKVSKRSCLAAVFTMLGIGVPFALSVIAQENDADLIICWVFMLLSFLLSSGFGVFLSNRENITGRQRVLWVVGCTMAIPLLLTLLFGGMGVLMYFVKQDPA